MIQVWHMRKEVRDANPMSWLKAPGDVVDLEEYEFVGVADTEDLDRAYYLSQNLEGAWGFNVGAWSKDLEVRSTSIGDVLVRVGIVYVVGVCGIAQVDTVLNGKKIHEVGI